MLFGISIQFFIWSPLINPVSKVRVEQRQQGSKIYFLSVSSLPFYVLTIYYFRNDNRYSPARMRLYKHSLIYKKNKPVQKCKAQPASASSAGKSQKLSILRSPLLQSLLKEKRIQDLVHKKYKMLLTSAILRFEEARVL